jgi:hypothetical protein
MTIRTALVVPILGTLASAQLVVGPEEPRGPWAAIAQAFTLTADSSNLRRKFAGDQTTYPAVFGVPATGVPDFRKTVLFPNHHMYVAIDAISTGNDRVPVVDVNGNWVLDANPNAATGWVNFVFSVTPQTTSNLNGAVSMRVASNGHASGDVFSVFAKDSDTSYTDEGIPFELVDRVILEHGFEHIGLSATDTIMALDPYIPLIAAGWHAGNLPELLSFTPLIGNRVDAKLYFSVTPASAADLTANGSGWISGLPNRALSAADILQIIWNGSGWSNPVVFRTAEELALSPDDDLTSLAVDGFAGPTVVFTPATNGGEIRANKSGSNGVIRTQDGLPIRLVRAGDVDALGAYDPEIATFHRAHGVPVALRTVMPKVGLSVAMDQMGAGYHVIMSGWPGPRTAGTFRLYISTNGNNWVPLGLAAARTMNMHAVGRYFPASAILVAPAVWIRAEYTAQGSPKVHSSWAVKLEQ